MADSSISYPPGGAGGGMSIGGAVASGAPQSVLFVDASGNLAQDNANLQWDYTNLRLNINSHTFMNGGIDVGDTAFYDSTVAMSIKSGRTWIFNMYGNTTNPLMFLNQNGHLSIKTINSGTKAILTVNDPNTIDNLATAHISIGASGDKGLIIQGFSTGNIQEWQNSSGSLLGRVDSAGNISGNNLSGTNTGDQTITLTGNVTGSGTGSFATTIASSVPLAGSPTTTTQSPSDNSTKIATTAYADAAVAAAVQGLSIKQSVQEATAAALPTNTYLAGVITITATGVLTVDGQTVALNDRVLVKDESTQANNGIYLCTTAGAVGVAAVLTRATDSNTGAKILGGFTFVETGTVNANSGFVNTNTTAPTIGTTAITYTQFSGAGEITAGNGLTKTGNTLDVVGTSNRITVAADSIDISSSYVGQNTITTLGTISTGVWNGTIITSGFGGTGNGFTKFSGPASSEKTFTLPNASATVLTDNALVTVAQGGSGVGTLSGILKGNGTSPFTAVTAPSGAIVGDTDTQTLTNKRVTNRVLALSAGSATPAINTDSYDVVHITAQTAAITSFTTNLTGTPVDGDTLRISITDDGTARALTWGTSFEASTVALPTTTVLSARLDVGFFWNTATSKWRCVAVA